ncbi:Pleiotropic negative transcriptional regulator [Quaeritorhiza haematococci]|nr:Pleiotropic negative transcriptional regulator [Quaeritorhiza haematococci]
MSNTNTNTKPTPLTAELYQSQFYRTVDQLEHFKIQIRLRKIADANVPLAQAHRAKMRMAKGVKEEESPLGPPKEMLVTWQEKVFSPREIVLHSRITKPADGLQQTYCKRVKEVIADADSLEGKLAISGRVWDACPYLFTYIDPDNYLDKEATNKKMTDSLNEELNDVALRQLSFRNRERTPLQGHKQDNPKTARGLHLDRPLLDTSCIEMHLMALLPDNRSQIANPPTSAAPTTTTAALVNPFSGASPEQQQQQQLLIMEGGKLLEKRLCSIRCYSNGLICMTPGLSRKDQPYRFEIGPDVYEYSVENAAETLSEADEEREWEIYQALYAQRTQIQQREVGTAFRRLPDAYRLRLNIFGEIISARDFPSSTSHSFTPGESLYVHYFFDLPGEEWVADETSMPLLSACTQACTATVVDEGDPGGGPAGCEVRFGFPFDVEVMARRLGAYTFDVPTWRPLGSPTDKMRSFFVGGSVEIEDVTYGAIPSGHKQPRMVKYGLNTETMGTLTVRLNVVLQTGSFKSPKKPAAEDLSK